MAEKKNTLQDVEIAKLTQWKVDFEKMFNTFMTNDFAHLHEDVRGIKNWLFYGFTALIGVTILTQILLRFFNNNAQ